jgi:hypothetical protein
MVAKIWREDSNAGKGMRMKARQHKVGIGRFLSGVAVLHYKTRVGTQYSLLYWYRGVTVLLPGWVIWK